MRIFLALALLALAAPAWAQDPLAPCEAAYEAGDYAGSTACYRFLAEEGNPWAQALLGAIYYDGDVVPQDYNKPNSQLFLGAGGILARPKI